MHSLPWVIFNMAAWQKCWKGKNIISVSQHIIVRDIQNLTPYIFYIFFEDDKYDGICYKWFTYYRQTPKLFTIWNKLRCYSKYCDVYSHQIRMLIVNTSGYLASLKPFANCRSTKITKIKVGIPVTQFLVVIFIISTINICFKGVKWIN